MAISNLLTPKFGTTPSMGMQTTTYSGVKPLAFAPKPQTGLVNSKLLPTQSPPVSPTFTTAPTTQPQQALTPPAPVLGQSSVPSPTPSRGLFPTVVSSLAAKAATPSPVTTEAQRAYEKAIEDKLKFERSAIETKKNIYDAPTSARVMQGRDLAVQQANASTRAALQGAVQEQQAAMGYGIQQQGLEQSALTSAAGFVKPTDQFPFVFDPATASFSAPGVAGGGAGALGISYNPTNDAQTFAQHVINHQISYEDAVRALGYAGATAETLLQQAITQGGGNLTQLKAQTGIQGTQEQVVQGYKSALQQGQNLQAQLKDLISTFQLNPNDLNAANIGIQAIARNTSDPRYALLQNYVNDVANTYSQILTPPGGSATDYTRGIAASMLDQTAKGTSILTIMEGLDAAANAKIAGVSTITPTGNAGGQTVQTSAGAINTNW